MRLPKTVNVCGKTVSVQANREHDGGSFDDESYIMEIGTKDPSEVAENFLHEVGEAIMVIRDFRYAKEREELENDDYRFLLNHTEWQLFAKDLAIALKGVSFKQ
jgi:hypothetical protein